jgi:hypothetical protein
MFQADCVCFSSRTYPEEELVDWVEFIQIDHLSPLQPFMVHKNPHLSSVVQQLPPSTSLQGDMWYFRRKLVVELAHKRVD